MIVASPGTNPIDMLFIGGYGHTVDQAATKYEDILAAYRSANFSPTFYEFDARETISGMAAQIVRIAQDRYQEHTHPLVALGGFSIGSHVAIEAASVIQGLSIGPWLIGVQALSPSPYCEPVLSDFLRYTNNHLHRTDYETFGEKLLKDIKERQLPHLRVPVQLLFATNESPYVHMQVGAARQAWPENSEAHEVPYAGHDPRNPLYAQTVARVSPDLAFAGFSLQTMRRQGKLPENTPLRWSELGEGARAALLPNGWVIFANGHGGEMAMPPGQVHCLKQRAENGDFESYDLK